MENASRALTAAAAAHHSFNHRFVGDDAAAAAAAAEHEDDEQLLDADPWETLTKNFREVDSLLERNRRLIENVNNNHRSKIPQNLARNVDLICEINSNMSKITGLYSNISTNLTSAIHQRRAVADKVVKTIHYQ